MSPDLLVIGAGINGAGVARDAALRGLSVVLVDKGNVASGTTSWSTRLIHERLAVENALAANAAGAEVRTHHRVERLLVEDRRVVGAGLAWGEEIRATVTANLAGPWVDEILGDLERVPAPLVGGTKGTHLVVGGFAGAPDEALYVEADDGRPCFILPWNELYLIGTTGEPYAGDLDAVVATDDEIDYLLAETNRARADARGRHAAPDDGRARPDRRARTRRGGRGRPRAPGMGRHARAGRRSPPTARAWRACARAARPWRSGGRASWEGTPRGAAVAARSGKGRGRAVTSAVRLAAAGSGFPLPRPRGTDRSTSSARRPNPQIDVDLV